MRSLWSIFVLLLILTACGDDISTDQPPEIRYGEEACDECHMLIQDKRFAAAYITEDGQPYRFDDIGDMFLHMQTLRPQIASAWLTPMGYGLAAFATRERAEAFAAEHDGMVMTFETLRATDANTLRDEAASHSRDD